MCLKLKSFVAYFNFLTCLLLSRPFGNIDNTMKMANQLDIDVR